MKINFFKNNVWRHRVDNFSLSYQNVSIIIALSLITTVTEVFSIGIFLPIFQFIRLEGDINSLISDSIVWQYAVDVFTYLNIVPSLLVLLIISFTLFLSRQIFLFFRLLYTVAVTQRIIQEQRNDLFDKYMDANTSYHDSVTLGSLVNVIMTEVQNAVAGVMAPLDLIVQFLMLFGYLILLSMLSWEMTLFSILILILAGIVPKFWIRQSAKTGRNLVNANMMMSEFLVGRLRSPRLVRLSGTENAEKSEFHSLTLKQRKHQVFSYILQLKTDVAVEPLAISASLIFLYFSYTVLHLQVEVIGLYLVIVMRLMPLVKTIISNVQSINAKLGPIEILEDRFKSLSNAKENKGGNEILSSFNKSILVDKVSYCYLESKEDALKDITIKFDVNKTTAIVGPSGSGKSTLIDLFPLIRIPTKGNIKIDGKSIAEYKLKSIRHLISYVPQAPQIFNGTVKEHILYGKSDASDEEIQEAAYLAGAEKFINQLPQKFDTNLGEEAIKLSGGQRQRLDLARALVRKAPVLILDEPTSNLDAESEETFKKTLIQICKNTNTTVIIVTHRLSIVTDADKIIVLNQGRVEATGVHNKLIQQKGWYAKAWNSQKLSIR